MKRQAKAERLLALHTAPEPLVLPNIWDPLGARMLVEHGYPVVATASAAISASLGYADGERLLRSSMIEMVARVADSVDVPVTADIEAGYAATAVELERTVREVLAAGAVGINLEDSVKEEGRLRDVAEQCERIATVRRTAERCGVHLVINARTDCFLSSAFADTAAAIDEAVSRAEAYTMHGADCIYPVGPGDEATVRTLRERIAAPINILAGPNAVGLADLARLGVNRVSFGPFVQRALLRRLTELVEDPASSLVSPLSGAAAERYLRDEPEAARAPIIEES